MAEGEAVTPLLLAAEVPAGVLVPLIVAAICSFALGGWAVVRYAARKWVEDTARPLNKVPTTPPALTQTGGGGSSAVHHELGEHESTLTHLTRAVEGLTTEVRGAILGWTEVRHKVATLEAATGSIASTVEDLRLHHERCGQGPSIPRRHTGLTGQHAAAPDVPEAPLRKRIPSQGGSR